MATSAAEATAQQGIRAEDILAALEAERKAAQQPAVFSVLNARRVKANVVLELEPAPIGKNREALDESLEGARAV